MTNYYKGLYGVTAMLLLLREQMRDSEYSTVVSRYIYESRQSWQSDSLLRAVESLGILLSLERNAAPMPPELIDELERNIGLLNNRDLNFSSRDLPQIADDLNTAKSVIRWYRNKA